MEHNPTSCGPTCQKWKLTGNRACQTGCLTVQRVPAPDAAILGEQVLHLRASHIARQVADVHRLACHGGRPLPAWNGQRQSARWKRRLRTGVVSGKAAHSIWCQRDQCGLCQIACLGWEERNDLRLHALACKRACPASTCPQCSLHSAPPRFPPTASSSDRAARETSPQQGESAPRGLPACDTNGTGPSTLAA